MKRKRTFSGITIVLYLAAGVASANRVEDGQQAYLAGDHQRAYDILQPLAEQGDGAAQVSLGILYERGHGVQQDAYTALEWYTRAARQDLPMVQHDLAVKLYAGNGIPQSYQEAARWWRRAAANGVAESAYSLGLMYPVTHIDPLSESGSGEPQGAPRSEWFALCKRRNIADGRFLARPKGASPRAQCSVATLMKGTPFTAYRALP